MTAAASDPDPAKAAVLTDNPASEWSHPADIIGPPGFLGSIPYEILELSMRFVMKEAASCLMPGFENSLAREMDIDSLVEVYRPRIFRFALASLRDRDAAETIAQDCFLKAYCAQASFRGDCNMQTWLMGIAVNLIRDYSRNRRLQFWKRTRAATMPADRISLVGSPSANESPETLALLRQQVECVWAAAALLSERQRSVFLLRFVEDMDILEIAAATEMKEGTVKKHLFRALQAVRHRMGKPKMGLGGER